MSLCAKQFTCDGRRPVTVITVACLGIRCCPRSSRDKRCIGIPCCVQAAWNRRGILYHRKYPASISGAIRANSPPPVTSFASKTWLWHTCPTAQRRGFVAAPSMRCASSSALPAARRRRSVRSAVASMRIDRVSLPAQDRGCLRFRRQLFANRSLRRHFCTARRAQRA